MHLFVTGGTGFFGKALLRHWKTNPGSINEYTKITILSRNPNLFISENSDLIESKRIHLHEGDIMVPHTLPEDKSISHVIHAATDSTIGPQINPLDRYLQIVKGTQNILEFSVANDVKRFLLTSSGGVYGPQPQNMKEIPESYCGMPDPMDPNSAYSVGKRAAEHLCALYANKYSIEVVVARCFAFVGPDLPLDVHFAIGNFIRDALFAGEIVINGDGSPIRSYMDQDDLALWLMVILEKGRNGHAYNVGSDHQITIADLAYLVRNLLCPNKSVRIKDICDGINNKNRYVPDIKKSRIELGLNVEINLHDSILKTASFRKYV